MQPNENRVLGFDPGYDRLGVAIIERNGKEKLVFSECFTTDKTLPFDERLGLIGSEVRRLIAEYQPAAVALERLYFTKNQKTAMKVAEARGVLVEHAARAGLPVFEYTPQQVKIAVSGHGGSDKAAVARMIPRLIELSQPILHDDEYDAIAVALTCLASERTLR